MPKTRPQLRRFAYLLAAISLFSAFAATPSTADPLDEIVLYASRASRTGTACTVTPDVTAAGSARLQSIDAGATKLTAALATPASYVELSFEAVAGRPYRLWIRAKADRNYWGNDSVFAQFSGAVSSGGSAIYRIGTTDAATINLEDCSGCGLTGWGWQDNGYGAGVLGPVVYFAASGAQTIRIQVREDGLGIDQIVLSAAKYLNAAPGPLKNDATILPEVGGGGGSPPPAGVTVVREPYLQQVSASSAVIVWATRESGAGEVGFRTGASAPMTVAATSTLYPAARTGLSADYYQHEARLTALSPSTTYEYDIFVNGVDPLSGSDRFVTAPATGTGTVRFIAFGDSGVGSTAQQQLSSMMAADRFDLALHGGDVAYGTGGGVGGATHQTMDAWFFSMYREWLRSRPMFPSLGNHDSRASNFDGRPYLDMFVLPDHGGSAAYPDHAERYYSFDYGPAHFVALDTELAFQHTARRAEQLAWLERDLSASNQPWKIAFFHRSPFSAGGEHGSDLAVRAAFAPIFERHGVQLVISAHEHVYERTKPWRTGSAGSPVTYIVAGGGGGPLYPSGIAEWTAFSASRHHYVRAEAGACRLTIEAVGTDAAVFDSVTLDRCNTPPPPAPSDDVILHAAGALVVAGNWKVVGDASAAGGARLQNTNLGAAKVTTAFATPADYFELTFEAQAGEPYRLWIRGKAEANYWGNDSVHVQFDGSVNAAGAPIHRIGSTDAAWVNLEDCSGCGISGWGWQDNGYGSGVLGPAIYFAQTGTQRMRLQIREDGFGIDQIVLSPQRFLTASPGALKNDATILSR
jgi:hypothetical protein